MSFRWPTSDLVVVTRTDQGWDFRPSPLRADYVFTLNIAVTVGCLLMAGFLFWAGRGLFIVGVMGGMAAFAAAVGIWRMVRARRLLTTPLIVEQGGSVCYDGRELCRSELVEAIQLKCVASGEHDNYNVYLVSPSSEVELPSPYFSGFFESEQAQARRFAERLAEALAVELRTSS
jgi:hypothetical protein